MTMLAQGVLPEGASTYADLHDPVFYFITGITVFFALLNLGLMVWFAIKYRARKGHAPQQSPKHSTPLELFWTIIPTIIVLIVFAWGFRTFLHAYDPPPDSYTITVKAKKWGWAFEYPNGVVTDDLYVPRGVPVKLLLTSSDVIHSLYVPAFRIKKDCVPGRTNVTWFEATRATEPDKPFPLYCTEYCGQQHAAMYRFVHVYEPDRFYSWVKQEKSRQQNLSPVERGQMLYRLKACNTCHSIDGSDMTGPTFKNLYGYPRQFADGSSIDAADEQYITESIRYPGNQVVAGRANQMSPYPNMPDDEVMALIAYIKSLSDRGGSPEGGDSDDGSGGGEDTPDDSDSNAGEGA